MKNLKTVLSVVLIILGILLLINKPLTGYNWISVAVGGTAKEYKMPNGSKLLYNSATGKYCAVVSNHEFALLKDLRLATYKIGIMDLESVCTPAFDFYESTDSSRVKYYVQLYYEHENGIGEYKSLTK